MNDGITALVRDHILEREKIPEIPKDEFGHELYYPYYDPVEGPVDDMIRDERWELLEIENRKLYEIGKDY